MTVCMYVAQIPLGLSRRLDTTRHVRSVKRVEASVSSYAVQTWRRTSYSVCLYKFSRFYALTYTYLICSVKWNKL